MLDEIKKNSKMGRIKSEKEYERRQNLRKEEFEDEMKSTRRGFKSKLITGPIDAGEILDEIFDIFRDSKE